MAASSRTTTAGDLSPSSLLPRLLPDLPDDISLQCIARLPYLSHPTLSLVSRSFRSLLLSSSIFTMRSNLHFSDDLLTISIRTPSSHPQFYLLDRHRHHSSKKLLLPLPSPPIPTVGSVSVSLGPFVFLLGGSVSNLPTSTVQIFDSRFRTWRIGPRMGVCRQFAAAGVVGVRIYVLGGCSPSSVSWLEALVDFGDGNDGRWDVVPSPVNVREKWMHGSAVLDGKILAVADRGGLVFKPGTDEWGFVSTILDIGWRGRAAVVGGIIYSYDFLGKIKGYDAMDDKWKEVEGIEKKLPKFLSGATLADIGGKLCVVWEGKGRRDCLKQIELMFAEIELVIESSRRLKGSVVWSDSIVLPIPKGSTIAHCVAVRL